MKKIIATYGGFLAAFAFVVSNSMSSFICPFVFHQPKMPDAVKKMRKF